MFPNAFTFTVSVVSQYPSTFKKATFHQLDVFYVNIQTWITYLVKQTLNV
jgi:hypothetical protein